MEPGRMDGGVEQSQTLMHTVLQKKQTQISYWSLQNVGGRFVKDQRFTPVSFYKMILSCREKNISSLGW